MADPKSYGVTVRFRDFEGEECYEARVRELPDIAEYADSLEEAYKLALDSIATTVEILQEKGRAVPEPEDVSDEFSGRITLRIPKTLHKSLAQRAQEEGVSLNSMLTTVLSAFHGFDSALKGARDGWLNVFEPAKAKPTRPNHSGIKVVNLSTYSKNKVANW